MGARSRHTARRTESKAAITSCSPASASGAAHTVELNLEASAGGALFAARILGRAAEIVPAYVARLLAAAGSV